MSKLSRILVPIDFVPSNHSAVHVALAYAAASAARTGAELHVLYVQILNRDLYDWAAVENMEGLEKAIHDQAEHHLNEMVGNIPQPVVHEIIKDIKESPAIVHYAKTHEIDQIVMGTHARKGVSRMFLGSVTAEVLRHSPVSVLAVGPEHMSPPNRYRRVLAPVDFSDSSSTALQQAAAIARQHEAELTVMHVIKPHVPMPYDIKIESSEEVGNRAVKALDEWLTKTHLPQDPQQKVLAAGVPDEQIASYAREHNTDLIVMGTLGRSGLGRLLLGSTTERVLRNVPCAVLAHRGAVLDEL